MTFDNVIAQSFGFLSLALGILTFYQKDDKKLKILMIVFNINHLVHYILLGSIVSALGSLLSAIRTATAIHFSSKWIAALFITISLVSGVLLADHIWQMWPILGTIIGTYSVFLLKGIRLRVGFLFGSSCWLINNILVGSIGGTILEITVISMNLITVYRIHKVNSYIGIKQHTK